MMLSVFLNINVTELKEAESVDSKSLTFLSYIIC